MGFVFKSANDLIRVLFEPACPGCRQLLEAPLSRSVCDVCWHSIEPVAAPFCRICGDALPGPAGLSDDCERCCRERPAYSIARSAGRFDGPLRELVHAFKFRRHRQLAVPLAELMRRAHGDLLSAADAVVPVPLHPIRFLQRGFNQADDLARQIRHPVWRMLRRARHGPSQASLPAAARRNLGSDYAPSIRVVAARRLRGRPFLQGATLVLIDDVMTTGATLDACARVLMNEGVKEVRALTAARAVVAPPPPRREPLPPDPSARR